MAKTPELLRNRNLTLYVLFVALLSVLGNALYELLKGKWQEVIAPLLVSVIGIVLLAVLLSHRFRVWLSHRREPVRLRVETSSRVTPAKGLIVFVAVGRGKSSAVEAADYHARGGALEHLWLVTSKFAPAVEEAKSVSSELRGRYPLINVHEIESLPDIYDIKLIKSRLEEIRRQAIEESRVPEEDLICDFTALTKSASAGMILACLPRGRRLQYMHPRQIDENGYAVTTAGSDPMEVDLAYQLEQEDLD